MAVGLAAASIVPCMKSNYGRESQTVWICEQQNIYKVVRSFFAAAATRISEKVLDDTQQHCH